MISQIFIYQKKILQRVYQDILDCFATNPVPREGLVTNVVAAVIRSALKYTAIMSRGAKVEMLLLQEEHRKVYILQLK